MRTLDMQTNFVRNLFVFVEPLEVIRTKMMVIAHEQSIYSFLLFEVAHKLLSSKLLHRSKIQEMHFAIVLKQGFSLVVRSQHSRGLTCQQFLRMTVKSIDSRGKLMVLCMLVQLSKQETMSAMDTVKKSYSCNSRVQKFSSLEVQ